MENFITSMKTERIFVFIVFMSLFVLGCMVFADYGMSTDEIAERWTGLVNLKYIGSLFSNSIVKELDPDHNIPNISSYQDRYYGVVLEIPLVLMEPVISKFFSKPAIWKFRHLVTFLYFFIGVLLFYKFTSTFFESRVHGLLVVLLIFLTPRFFAESFYNIKDIAFFASYLATFYFFYKFLATRSIKYTVLLSLFSALSSAVRVFGVLFVLLAGCIVIIEMLQKKENLRKGSQCILLLGCSFSLFLVLFYPASWHNPFVYYFDLVEYMGHHPWGGSILYMGKIVSGHAVPWHYLPVWIAITTPVPIIFFFIYGLYKTIRQSIFDIRHNQISNKTYIYLGSFFIIFLPIVAAIAGNSTIYNGWRQFYFIYSAMLIITIAGIKSFYETSFNGKKKLSVAGLFLSAVCVIYALYTAVWMVRNHPYQNVYFNLLAGKTPYALFERDYWGLSLRDGLEYVLSHDNRSQITISCYPNQAIKRSLAMIDERDSRRITLTNNLYEADYLIDYYRNYYLSTPDQYYGQDEVYSVKVDNFKIMSVVKLR
jgi:hypothetical protein